MPIKRQFDRNDSKICSKDTLYEGFFQIQSYTVQHRLFEGGWSPEYAREMYVRIAIWWC